jgi:hypothetical protein
MKICRGSVSIFEDEWRLPSDFVRTEGFGLFSGWTESGEKGEFVGIARERTGKN